MFEETTTPGDSSPRPGVSRRQVVKIGANAAWAVPLVSVATAAPALAVSGQGALTMSYFRAYFEKNRRNFVLDLGPIKNTGAGTTGQVTVVFRIPRERTGPFSKPPQLLGPRPKGWSFAGRRAEYSAWVFTFVSHSELDPGESTPRLRSRYRAVGSGSCSTLRVTATANARNATPAATAANLQCPAPRPGGGGGYGGNSGGGNSGGGNSGGGGYGTEEAAPSTPS